MNRSNAMRSLGFAGTLWRMLLGLWLFAGFLSWTASASHNADGRDLPLVTGQVEQLVLAGNGDNARVRPASRYQGLADGSNDIDNPQSPEQPLASAPAIADWRLFTAFQAVPAFLYSPSHSRYRLPAQRAPPNA